MGAGLEDLAGAYIGKWRNYVKTVLTYFVLNNRVQYSQVKKQAVGLLGSSPKPSSLSRWLQTSLTTVG